MRATPGKVSACALERTDTNPSERTCTRKLRFMPTLTGKAAFIERAFNGQHCRFPARSAALQAAQVLCSRKPQPCDVLLPEDGLAYLSHERWFSATGRAM